LILETGEGGDERWIKGRAGMMYKDMLPGRLGGRFIASIIKIPTGGPSLTTSTTTR
jgi:hypothetical protein